MTRPHRRFLVRGGVGAALLLAGLTTLLILGGGGLSGRYEGLEGNGTLEFKGRRVYITTSLGSTFVAPYELDGNRVIIQGSGGSQVYTLDGQTLNGGLGIKFVKK